MRMKGHAIHDAAEYVPKPLFEYWKKRDPIARFENYLVNVKKWLTRAENEKLIAGVEAAARSRSRLRGGFSHARARERGWRSVLRPGMPRDQAEVRDRRNSKQINLSRSNAARRRCI